MNWLNLGLKPDEDFLERRKVQVSNFIITFLIGLNLINLFIYKFYYFNSVLLTDSVVSLIFGGFFFILHWKGFRVLVRHLVVLSANASIINLCAQFGSIVGLHYYLLFASIVSFLIFDSWYNKLFYNILGIGSFLILEKYFLSFPLHPDPGLAFGHFPNVIISFGMITMIIYIFKRESIDYQSIVQAQNRDLSNLTVKLMFQKDEALITSNQLKKKSKILEQQNQSIVDSLRLASMLQRESLPSEDTLFHGLAGGILIYKAMQMVSGDFFWGKQTYEGQIIIIADCIGHGVPGGMMAILSANLISQIVEDNGKTFPSDILSELDSRLRRRIKQDINSEIGDGMDIALVLVSAGMVSFSSASRPLLKISKDGSHQLIPGNRFQLASGKLQSNEFETVEIETNPGDRFFLFTDGITDQFSSSTGKKLGTKGLISALLQMQSLPLKKQKAEIENFLTTWQDKEKQTDDMLLVGFEV